jgi:hypothetical protein
MQSKLMLLCARSTESVVETSNRSTIVVRMQRNIIWQVKTISFDEAVVTGIQLAPRRYNHAISCKLKHEMIKQLYLKQSVHVG